MTEIAVAYDGSTESERALVRAADLADALSARLVVVSVTQPTPPAVPALEPTPPGPVLVPGAAGPIGIAGADRPTAAELGLEPHPNDEEIAERQLERARSTLGERSIEVEYLPEFGDAAERLLEVGAARDAELLVVGSREHGFFARLFSAPVEEEVARHADRDVLLVH
jgi:nucleotide-binding universal stress UspA family protein